MNNYGFLRVAAAVPVVKVADTDTNADRICALISEASSREVSLVVFPELSVTGYTCGDLFGQQLLVRKAEKAVVKIMEHTFCSIASSSISSSSSSSVSFPKIPSFFASSLKSPTILPTVQWGTGGS